MKFTYRDLKEFLDTVPDERLDDDVTITLASVEEYYPVTSVEQADVYNDILDEGHIFLSVMDI